MSQREEEHHQSVITEEQLNAALREYAKLMSGEGLDQARAEADAWAEANGIQPILPKKHSWVGVAKRISLQIVSLILVVLTGVSYMGGSEVYSAPVGIFEYITFGSEDKMSVVVGEVIVPADWHNVFVPMMIWEGFELTEEKIERLGHKLRYDNLETGEYVVFLQYSQNMTINMFTEGEIEYEMIQGRYMANVYVQNNIVNIYWTMEDVTIRISSNMGKEEIIEFANQIKWRE